MELLTTRSWDFLGMEKDNIMPPNSLWNKARFGEDVIIGNIDTDFHGHGTHTLSTVGGSFVKNVSAFGNVGDGQRKEGPLKPEWHLIEYA
ncbi:hypothetical protein CISIN_1g041208mg, partial [Citrus sinensis]